MKRCFIHIGNHKTGTTSIQQILGQYDKQLASAGILVPKSVRSVPGIGVHHQLAFDLNRDPRFRPSHGGLGQLVAELAEASEETAIISSEALASTAIRPKSLGRLRSKLIETGFEPIWIFYLRSYPEWAESAYTQLAKELKVTRPIEDCIDQLGGIFKFGRSPATVLEPLSRTGDTVILRSYDQAVPRLISDFFSQVGLHDFDPNGDINSLRTNSRPSVIDMEFLTRAAIYHEKNPGDGIINARKQARELLTHLPNSPLYRGLSEGLAKRLRESTRSAYEELLQTYRPDCSFDEFFPTRNGYKEQIFKSSDYSAKDLKKLEKTVSRFKSLREKTSKRAS